MQDYLGHTQSANYTFGPWRSNAFRYAPVAFLPAVKQPRQQQQAYDDLASARCHPPQQQQLQKSPPSLYRSHTAVDCSSWKQQQQPPTSTPAVQTNGYSWSTPPVVVGGGLTRSKTSIPDVGGLRGGGGCFDASYRPGSDEANGRLQYGRASTAGDQFQTGGCGGGGGPVNRPTGSLDWASWTRAELSSADRARSASELVRADVLSLCRDSCDRTRRIQADTTRRIGDRVTDVKFWRDEVRKESDLASGEAVALQRAIGSLERARGDTEAPLRIAEECLGLRRQKIGGELVHDEVEDELIKV